MQRQGLKQKIMKTKEEILKERKQRLREAIVEAIISSCEIAQKKTGEVQYEISSNDLEQIILEITKEVMKDETDNGIKPELSAVLSDAESIQELEETTKTSPPIADVSKSLTPHRCPVCNGNGIVPNGFYTQTSGHWSTSSITPETCRTCSGAGIVWG